MCDARAENTLKNYSAMHYCPPQWSIFLLPIIPKLIISGLKMNRTVEMFKIKLLKGGFIIN